METEVLIDNWKRTKSLLTAAQEAHLQSEIGLYNAVKDDLPDKGVYHAGDIKITTGYFEKWDQESLSSLQTTWDNKLTFPFKGEWKPDGKQIGYIREHAPHAYKLLAGSLTLTPKKPSFTLKEKD